jgi:hypothetical protein
MRQDTDATATATALKALLRKRRLGTTRLAGGSGVVPDVNLFGSGRQRPDGAGALAPSSPTFVDNGGRVLNQIHVWLLFWGRAWAADATPAASEVIAAVNAILNGQYMGGLTQYRGVARGSLGGALIVKESDPPDGFTNADVAEFVRQQMEIEAIPEPDDDPQAVYFVVPPAGVPAGIPNVVGEHSYFVYYDLADLDLPPDLDIANAYYAWVTNDGTLDTITTIFSHELVETCTDPNGDAIQGVPGSCSQDGWCEIGDVCTWRDIRNAIMVQSYWSQTDGACILPGTAASQPSVSTGPVEPAIPAKSVENVVQDPNPLEGLTMGTQGPSWPAALVALGFLAFVGAIFVVVYGKDGIDGAIKAWALIGTVVGVLTGAIPSYFFHQAAAAAQKDVKAAMYAIQDDNTLKRFQTYRTLLDAKAPAPARVNPN